MNQECAGQSYPLRQVHDVTSTALRMVPKGRQRAYCRSEDIYQLFLKLYKDAHPRLDEQGLARLLRVIFPVYKNPRKGTLEFKITTHGLTERLCMLGLNHFPVDIVLQQGGITDGV